MEVEAPRITLAEGASKPVYQFASLGSLADNLESRNFKFVLDTKMGDPYMKDGKEVRRSYHEILGKLDNRNAGVVKFALKNDCLKEEPSFEGSKKAPKLTYAFIQPNSANYNGMVGVMDTQEDFDRVYRHLRPVIEEAFQKDHPGQTSSLHCPQRIRFAKPKGDAHIVYSKGKSPDVTPAFVTKGYVDRDGLIQARLGRPWAMAQESIENYTIGMTFTLDRSKYFTDAQIIARNEEKVKEKAAKRGVDQLLGGDPVAKKSKVEE